MVEIAEFELKNKIELFPAFSKEVAVRLNYIFKNFVVHQQFIFRIELQIQNKIHLKKIIL